MLGLDDGLHRNFIDITTVNRDCPYANTRNGIFDYSYEFPLCLDFGIFLSLVGNAWLSAEWRKEVSTKHPHLQRLI